MKKLVILIFILSLIVTCTYDNPYNIDTTKVKIPEKQFENILFELHLARQIKYSPEFTKQYYSAQFVNVSDSILATYGYTKADLDSTIAAYSSNPRKIEEMYDRILSRLSKIDGQLKNEMKKDTLRK